MFRKAALLGLAGLGLLSAADAFALAEGWYVPYPGSDFACAAGRTQTDPADHRLAATVVVGHIDIRACEALCAERAGCVAYSYIVQYSTSGAETDFCQLYSERDTRNTTQFMGGRFDYAMMCYRKLTWQERMAREDYGQQHSLRTDDIRPGLPSAGIPSAPTPHKH